VGGFEKQAPQIQAQVKNASSWQTRRARAIAAAHGDDPSTIQAKVDTSEQSPLNVTPKTPDKTET
jgi:hypothetical protein